MADRERCDAPHPDPGEALGRSRLLPGERPGDLRDGRSDRGRPEWQPPGVLRLGPPHVIWVAGINKLVPNLEAGLQRVREVALPLEDQRMKRQGSPGSSIGKLVIYERERPGRITLVLAGERLGY